MIKLKKIISKIKYYINYLYYVNSSLSKNVYPYKLVGEKFWLIKNEIIVSYKIIGQGDIKEISLQNLLNDKKHIEKFHPLDALKIGSLSFECIIHDLPLNERKNKFNLIKNVMLNSVHDIIPNKYSLNSSLQSNLSEPISKLTDYDYIDSIVSENTYPCKLVGGKQNYVTTQTIIVFTILGKREGYEKILSDLIQNTKLIENFHPTEAIKFGFIFSGESYKF